MHQIFSIITLVFLAFLGQGSAISSSWSSRTITFPLRNMMSTIDLRTDTSDAPHLPTGKCEDVGGGDVTLYLPKLSLQKLHVGIIESIHVSCLSFRDNLIDHIDMGTFNRLPNLLFLDLSKNRIPYCDLLTFGGHSMLKTLILDENEVPGNDAGHVVVQSDIFVHLQHLYMRKNALRRLEFPFRRSFPSLTHLYLSDNYFETDNFLVNPSVTLTHLHLERNRIYRFHGVILMNLHSLFLDDNRISTICYKICDTSSLSLRNGWKLRVLSLMKNSLMTIERDAFTEARNLTTLNLSHNKIQVILPGTFDTLTQLQDLSLNDNRLITIPDFNRNTYLTSLSLSRNEIEIVSNGAFCHLTMLKWLSLGGNRIRTIENGALLDLVMLEELDLSDNKLDYLTDGWLVPQINLKRLDVKGNRFTTVKHLSLNGAVSLTYVYMQNNFIKQIGITELIGLGSDVVVYLENECLITKNPCYETCDENSRNLKIPYIRYS